MQGMKPKPTKGPEAIIQEAIIKFLTLRGWFCIPMHGNMYQRGVPDIYCCKRRYGARWIEVKNSEAYRFTPAQIETFPRLSAEAIGVWILVAATQREYEKLFKPPNWWTYLHIPDMNK